MFRFILIIAASCLLLGCQSAQENPESVQREAVLEEIKLDSLKSILTIVVDDGAGLFDARTTFTNGVFRKSSDNKLESVSLKSDSLIIDSLQRPLAIELINIESWDSAARYQVAQDSSFLLRNPTHVALSDISIGDVSNELMLLLYIQPDSSLQLVEGKVSLNLRDWNQEISEDSGVLHLGFVVYPLSEEID